MVSVKKTNTNIVSEGVGVACAPWIRLELLFPVFGINGNQASKYRATGVWLEGTHWKKDPANRIVFNVPRITQWLEQ